jgi:hypothetical protein
VQVDLRRGGDVGHRLPPIRPGRSTARRQSPRGTIEGRPGILRIEAKAHDQELIKEETGRGPIDIPTNASRRRNLLRIDWAIRDASVALADQTGLTWALSRDWNYQMSNRFAWRGSSPISAYRRRWSISVFSTLAK